MIGRSQGEDAPMSTLALWSTITGIIAGGIGIYYALSRFVNWVIRCRQSRALPHHPPELARGRGELHACTFSIDGNYQSDSLHRWESLADIEVQIAQSPFSPSIHVYLIPSGRAPRCMHHPQVLKSDTEALRIKRNVSILFAKKWNGHDLEGFYFSSVQGFPTVYSTAYDNFLKASARKWR